MMRFEGILGHPQGGGMLISIKMFNFEKGKVFV
jgi:hypothetical protein